MNAPQDPQELAQLKAQFENALTNAHTKLGAGTPLHQSVDNLLKSLGADPNDAAEVAKAMSEIGAKIQHLKTVLSAPGVTDADRQFVMDALAHATNPSHVLQMPNSNASKEAAEILKDITGKLGAIKAPPSLRKYGKMMWLRPAAEVGGAVVEGGLATLVLNAVVLSLTGFAPAAGAVGHVVTWTAASAGWNLGVNSSTKATALQEIANKGSVGRGFVGMFKNPKTKRLSPTRTLTTSFKVGSILLLLGGGVAMIQKVFGDVDDSARNARLLAEPLKLQQIEFEKFKASMLKFAPILPEILKIAARIEAGKAGGGPVAVVAPPPDPKAIAEAEAALVDAQQKLEVARQTKGKQDDVAAQAAVSAAQKRLTAAQNPPAPPIQRSTGSIYSQSEKDEMKRKLAPLFRAAGLDEDILTKLQFADPTRTGEGPIFEFKQALGTGDTSKLRDLKPEDLAKLQKIFPGPRNTSEMVIAIRKGMGLEGKMTYEQRIAEIIRKFFTSKELTRIYGDLDSALLVAGRIEAQGNDVRGTAVRAILKGDPPITIEAVAPYNKAILDSREPLRLAAAEQVSKPIKDMFDVLEQALGQVGGTVKLVEMPASAPDMTPLQNLQTLIEKLVEQSSDAAVKEKAIQSNIKNSLLQFVPGMPGSPKAKGMENYVARQMATYIGGYHVEVNGPETRLFERKSVEGTNGFNPHVANQWDKYLWQGTQLAAARDIFPQVPVADVSGKSDAELGQAFRGPIQKYLESLQGQQSRQKDPQLMGVSGSYQELLGLSDEQLGITIRIQGVAQLKTARPPIIYPPKVWDMIMRGIAPMKTAVDFSGWAQEATAADPSFGNTVFKDISQMDDDALGKLARDHVTRMVAGLTTKQQSGNGSPLVEHMITRYNPMAATADERLTDLGRKIRVQIVHQIQHRMAPLAVYPDTEWDIVLNPSLAASLTEKIDLSEWREIPPERAKEIFGKYQAGAQMEAAAFATIPVLFLSLGAFLFAAWRVAQKNANLLKVKDSNLDAWRKVESEMLEAIKDFQAILSKLPFFQMLPPMDPYMLLSALRSVAEEYQDDVKQDFTFYESIKHHAKATLAPGPYAEPVAEMFAMERIMSRLSKDKKAQRKLADIIAPGLYEVIELAQKAPKTQAGSTALDDYLVYISKLDIKGAELFRNAARGHLRFREDVLDARTALGERASSDLVKTPAMKELRAKAGGAKPLSEFTEVNLGVAANATLFKLLILNAESEVVEEFWKTHQVALDKFDTDALAEEMLNRYSDPSSRRAEIASMAAKPASSGARITIPARGEILKTFSVVGGIQRDLDKKLAGMFPANRGLPQIGEDFEKAYESAFPGEQCKITLEIDNDGEMLFIATITDTAGAQRQAKCLAPTFANALDDTSRAAQDFVSTVRI